MNPRPAPIPLRPDPGAMRNANVTALVRACTAAMAGAYDKVTSPTDVLASRWPHDRNAARLLETRAAVNPWTTSSLA